MSSRAKPLPGDLVMGCTAILAMTWAIARACVQSVTIDEAVTYLQYVSRHEPFQWFPAEDNHILNSALMRLFTAGFGPSHIAVRAPALIGAAIYIAAAWYVCRLLGDKVRVQWPLFVCLVFNPFVFDFLVAARGYGLATAFLLCAIVIPAGWKLRAGPTGGGAVAACAACSVFVALSFASNFSYAFAGLAVLFMIWLWVGGSSRFNWRILAACILPGLGVTVLLTLYAVLHWPPGRLSDGATSLRQTLRSITDASLYELNLELANPLVYVVLSCLKPLLFPLLGVAVLGRAAMLWLNRGELAETRSRWKVELAGALAGAAALALSAHWLAFKLFHLLLPLNRTALFFVPLTTLAMGAAMAIPSQSRGGNASRLALLGAFYLFAIYFLFCMRLTYFREWKFDADAKNVYSVVAYYNHAYCVEEVPATWYYVASLNFYRKVSGRETLAEFAPQTPYPTDRPLYVLNSRFDDGFIHSQGLSVVYRSESTQEVVAVRPDRLTRRACP